MSQFILINKSFINPQKIIAIEPVHVSKDADGKPWHIVMHMADLGFKIVLSYRTEVERDQVLLTVAEQLRT